MAKPSSYHELDERKICHFCANNDTRDTGDFIYFQWCHMHYFEPSPIGNCEEWEEVRE